MAAALSSSGVGRLLWTDSARISWTCFLRPIRVVDLIAFSHHSSFCAAYSAPGPGNCTHNAHSTDGSHREELPLLATEESAGYLCPPDPAVELWDRSALHSDLLVLQPSPPSQSMNHHPLTLTSVPLRLRAQHRRRFDFAKCGAERPPAIPREPLYARLIGSSLSLILNDPRGAWIWHLGGPEELQPRVLPKDYRWYVRATSDHWPLEGITLRRRKIGESHSNPTPPPPHLPPASKKQQKMNKSEQRTTNHQKTPQNRRVGGRGSAVFLERDI